MAELQAGPWTSDGLGIWDTQGRKILWAGCGQGRCSMRVTAEEKQALIALVVAAPQLKAIARAVLEAWHDDSRNLWRAEPSFVTEARIVLATIDGIATGGASAGTPPAAAETPTRPPATP